MAHEYDLSSKMAFDDLSDNRCGTQVSTKGHDDDSLKSQLTPLPFSDLIGANEKEKKKKTYIWYVLSSLFFFP